MRAKRNLAVPTPPDTPKWSDDPEVARKQLRRFVEELREWVSSVVVGVNDALTANAIDHDEIDERLTNLGG